MGNNIISLTDHILITILNLKCIQIENYVLCSLLKLRCQVNTVNIALLKYIILDSANHISDCAVAQNLPRLDKTWLCIDYMHILSI